MNIDLDYTITGSEFFAFDPPSTNSRWTLASRWIDRIFCAAVIAFLSATAWHAVTAGIDSYVWSNINSAVFFFLVRFVFPMLFRALMVFALRNFSIQVSIGRDGVILRAKALHGNELSK